MSGSECGRRSGADGALDQSLTVLSLAGYATPSFWLAMVLAWVVGVKWHLLPAAGMENPLLDPEAGSLARMLDVGRHLVLPALTLSIVSIAGTMRYQRSAMLEVLHLPYIVTARAKGLPERSVTWRHAWRNAFFPVLTLFGLWLPLLVTGSVFVESVFAWPGLGSLAVGAVGLSRLPAAHGHVAARCGGGRLRQPAHRSGLCLSRPEGTALVSALLDPLRRAWQTPRGRTGAMMLLVIAALAVFAPPFLPDPLAQPDPLEGAGLAPSAQHPFGTDQLSRDVLARVATGGRVSLAVALIAVGLSITLGAMSASSPGTGAGSWMLSSCAWWTARSRSRGSSFSSSCWPCRSGYRCGRSSCCSARRDGSAPAASCGRRCCAFERRVTCARRRRWVRRRRRIIFSHLLPNTLGPLLVAATLGVGDVILLEAGLSFLGLGIQPPAPSWGGMILDAREVLVTSPWAGIFPGIAIVLTVLSANLLGDAVRDAVDPRGA